MEGDPDYCDGNKMLLDEACLVIQNSARRSVYAYNVSSECFDCSPQRLMTVNPYSTKSVILSTTYDAILQFNVGNFTSKNLYHFGQHGHYKFHVHNDNVTWSTTDAPVSTYGPLWYALFTLTFAVALWGFICWLFTLERVTRYLPSCTLLARNVVIRDVGDEDLGGPSQRHRSSGDASPLIQTPPTETVKESNRTMSLDVFRGLTVTLMIFVNYGGGKYSIFEHSAWNGLTFADIVFPWFVWIMGISLALSIQSQLRNTVSRNRVFVKVLLRSLILIALGIILNSFKNNNVDRLRIPGVLQRLGLAFFIVGSVEAFLITPQNHITVLVGRAQMVSDFIYGWKQWVIMASLVILHTCLVMFVKLDGCPQGYHGPGGLHMNGKAFNCTGGLTGYIDRMIFGVNHIYQHPTSSQVYNSTIPFDPEGLLGTLTTAFNMFLGVNAGRVLIVFPSSIQRNARWISSSFFCGIVALVLTASSKDHGIIPINKNLWSLSFVLASSSLASAAFIVLYTLIDDGKMWNGAPFRQVGRNALFLYVGHIITKNALPWNWAPIDMTSHGPLLWMNLWSTALWVIIAVIMDWCQIYITI